MTARLATGLALVVAACGSAGDAPIDAPGRDAPEPCVAASLELGRCVTDAGAPCTGDAAEVRRFAAVAAGGPVPLVVGPQSSSMLVLAIRTAGIVPGDPVDPASPSNPLIAIEVSRAGTVAASYRGRSAFVDDGAGQQVAAGLFVVTDGGDLGGAALAGHAEVTDAAGAARCGDLAFVVGTP